jgi:hypothetical protein
MEILVRIQSIVVIQHTCLLHVRTLAPFVKDSSSSPIFAFRFKSLHSQSHKSRRASLNHLILDIPTLLLPSLTFYQQVFIAAIARGSLASQLLPAFPHTIPRQIVCFV